MKKNNWIKLFISLFVMALSPLACSPLDSDGDKKTDDPGGTVKPSNNTGTGNTGTGNTGTGNTGTDNTGTGNTGTGNTGTGNTGTGNNSVGYFNTSCFDANDRNCWARDEDENSCTSQSECEFHSDDLICERKPQYQPDCFDLEETECEQHASCFYGSSPNCVEVCSSRDETDCASNDGCVWSDEWDDCIRPEVLECYNLDGMQAECESVGHCEYDGDYCNNTNRCGSLTEDTCEANPNCHLTPKFTCFHNCQAHPTESACKTDNACGWGIHDF